jgi:membrane protease YdiL (CAAX protease family)/O-antigen/teichoic acid export membrane protein
MKAQMHRIAQVLATYKVILINAISLMGTVAVTSGLGFGFWWIVARQFSLTDAGLASAVISSMLLLGTVGMMGMGTLLIGELSRHPRMELSLIVTALVVVGAAGVLFGSLFAWLAPRFSNDFALLSSDWESFILFVSGVGITGMVFVLDQAVLGVLRGGWQLWRNTVFSLGKLVLLVPLGLWFSSSGARGIYDAWLAGNILSILFLLWLIKKNPIPQTSFRLQWMIFWDLRYYALAHHALNLALQFVQFTMPIIVTILLSAATNASFYIAWIIASSLFIVPTALTQTLYAVSASDLTALSDRMRFTLRLSFLGVFGAGFVIFALAGRILGFFNAVYAETATDSLRVLLLAALPVIVRVHYVAIHQIRRHVNRIGWLFWGMALWESTMAVAGATAGGLVGLCAGWVIAVYAECTLMIPAIYQIAIQAGDEMRNPPRFCFEGISMKRRAESGLVLLVTAVLSLLAEWFLQIQRISSGLLLYSILLQALLLYGAYRWGHPPGRLIVLAIPAIIRLMNFTLPLGGLSPPFAQFLIAVPLLLTAIVFVWLFRQGRFELNFDWHRIPYYLLLIAAGCGVGFLLSLFRTPEPLKTNSPLVVVFHGFVLLFGAACMEEWLFRNIMQGAVAGLFGQGTAVPIVAYFYTALHVGQGSLLYVLAVFAVSLGLGWLRRRGDGLADVCLVHGAANIMFFLVLA